MVIALLAVCFFWILCFGCLAAYIIGYRKGREKAAAYYARQFAKGVRLWLLEDFKKNGDGEVIE